MSNILSDEEIDAVGFNFSLQHFDEPEGKRNFAHAVIEAYRAKLIAGVVIPEAVGCIAGRRLTPEGTREFFGEYSRNYKTDKKEDVFNLTHLQEAIAAARLLGAK